MKKVLKNVMGVTLLEVMLVLAIAAMIIVMSVRYYQSASSSQQANAILQQIQGVVAGANSLAQAKGSYSGANINNSTLLPLLPGGALTTPWGDPITVAGATATSFTIDIGSVPSGVCPLLTSKLSVDNHFSTTAACNATASTAVTYTYTSNP
jgi:type II secretory pathway pseudopilin PulG